MSDRPRRWPSAVAVTAIALGTIAAGCAGSADPRPMAHAPRTLYPLGSDRITTTSGAIFERNLESRIAGLEARIRRGPAVRADQLALASALRVHASYRGDPHELRRAATLVEEAVNAEPRDPDALVLRARHRL